MICTFFGHSDTPKEIEPLLRATLKELIEDKGVYRFYVGNHGSFDYMVRTVLKELKLKYSEISYWVVLAYLPEKCDKYTDYSDTILPDGIEKVPYRYRVSKRNRWMIEKSDYVVTYVANMVGGANQFKMIAEKKGKMVINLFRK